MSAAIFGEEILLKLGGIPSKAITPFHLENMKFFDQGTPVCILSYGGSNTDIVKGAAFRLARAKISNCLIFCGDKESDLARIANRMNWHFMLLPAQERGFVSTVGMLAMISSLISIFVPDEIIDKASKTFEYENLNGLLVQASKLATEQSNYIFANERNPHLVCVASGWGLPALTDFESKITEGGVCTIEIAEMKNFTHGRYINTFSYRKNRIMIIFQSPEDKELSQFLVKKFNRYVPVIVVKTEKNGIGGALELMVKGLFLAGKLGEKKGIDISKPHKYPPEARGLYSWEPKYRKELDISQLLETV